jgi:hypothetical protein
MSTSLDPFEDELTRELPSALRTFTDLAPVTELAAEDILEIEERDLILEHTVRIARPASVPAFALDLAAGSPTRPWDNPLAFIICGALLVACLLAGAIGIVAGRTLSAGDPTSVTTPRVAVVAAARELITMTPPSAPAKVVVPPPPPPPPRMIARAAIVHAPAPAPPSPTPSGRGHLGSDRERLTTPRH